MEPAIGEIRLFAGPYAPRDWHFCDGSALSIVEHEILYSLIGTTYGGSGDNFNLPDLRGRVVVGQGQGSGLTARALGQSGGSETVALTITQLPAHGHDFYARNAAATDTSPADRMLGTVTPSGSVAGLYIANNVGNQVKASVNFLDYAGGSGQSQAAPHSNVMASLVINYIIALVGLYPEKS